MCLTHSERSCSDQVRPHGMQVCAQQDEPSTLLHAYVLAAVHTPAKGPATVHLARVGASPWRGKWGMGKGCSQAKQAWLAGVIGS